MQCIDQLPHDIEVKDPKFSKFPTTLIVTLNNIPGPVKLGDKVKHIYSHRLRIDITEEYPYQKPIVRWQSDIFHPNIVPPERGGWVCTKLLDNWDLSSNLLTIINGMESLLVKPNPKNPYKDDTTMRAALYFKKHPYKPPIIV